MLANCKRFIVPMEFPEHLEQEHHIFKFTRKFRAIGKYYPIKSVNKGFELM